MKFQRVFIAALLISMALSLLPLGLAEAGGATPTPGKSGYRWYVSDIDGSYQPYGVYLPANYNPAEPPGVVIYALHGWGGNTTTSFGSTQKTWANNNNAMLVSLRGRGNQNYDSGGEVDLFEALADLKQAFPYNEDRLFVEGCSMGGHGAYRWPLRYPGMFAASVPQAGWTSYEDFYFKWYASLTEDVGHWGFNNGNVRSSLSAAQYSDPARRPALETASSYYQAENGKYEWFFMHTSTGDTVNYPENSYWIQDAFTRFGYTQWQAREVSGGHCPSGYDAPTKYAFFVGKTRTVNPASPVYTTNTLTYNQAYWLQIDRLRYANQWARIGGNLPMANRIEIQTTNISQYTLNLAAGIPNLDMNQPIEIYTDGLLSYKGPAQSGITIYAVLGADLSITGWSAENTLPSGLRKNSTLAGPIGDAFRSKFAVVVGTSGTAEQTAKNAADAGQFVNEWNTWMISSNSAWGFPEPQQYLQAIEDTQVTPELIASSNLRLFGDATSNLITAQIANQLPVQMLANGITLNGRTYEGDSVNYTLIYPNPLNTDKYVVVGRGYQTEGYYPGVTLAKNLERLPWDKPDYVVWDANRTPGPTVAGLPTSDFPGGITLLHLPDQNLEAGYFTENWDFDNQPPVTTLIAERSARNEALVTLTAADNLGGFGVAKTEYRVDNGEWIVYTGPFTLSGRNLRRLEYRSVDQAGRDVSPAGLISGNVEATQVAFCDARDAVGGRPRPASSICRRLEN